MPERKEEMLRLMTDTGVYLVTEDRGPAAGRLRVVEAALDAGARVVQLRDRGTSKRELIAEARAMKAACAARGAVFIVNDDVALAWASGADGVHVGQGDFPPEEATRLLGEDKLIGLSVSALDEAIEAERLGVDYIGVGAIYSTPTKPDAELGGLELLRAVRGAVGKPLVAIGGIDAGNAADVFAAGADAVAVVRAVFAAPDVAGATRRLLDVAKSSKGGGRQE
jgi:thiamine-phosphate pyrophosphorylase